MRQFLFFLLICFTLSLGAQQPKSSGQKSKTTAVSQKKTTATKKSATPAKSSSAKKPTAAKKPSASKQKSASGKKSSGKKSTPSVPMTKDIKRLKNEHESLLKQINESQTLLSSTKKNVKSQLASLALIDGKIDAQQKYVRTIQSEVDTLAYNLRVLIQQLMRLEEELQECKRKYSKGVMYMYRNRQAQNKLMFIFSADDFQQMYRRLRYVQEYARYQRAQGRIIEQKEQEIEAKRAELESTRVQKQSLLNEGRRQQQILEAQKTERQKLVNELNEKQRQLQKTLRDQQRKSEQLNARIDALIQEEIRKAEERRRQEEARRKAEQERLAREKAAAEKKRAAAASSGKGSSKSSSRSSSKSSASSGTSSASKSSPKFNAPDETDLRLSSNFAANQGRLPMPITGSYVVTSGFGRVNAEGLKGVYLDNKGIDITGKSGAQARCVFDGEVSAVFSMGGMTNVLVRHGKYITVYCNLASASVRTGQKVSTNQTLGPVARDENGNVTLHFQIRRETTKLNPSSWLRH